MSYSVLSAILIRRFKYQDSATILNVLPGMIEGMVGVLEKEQGDDDAQKGFCAHGDLGIGKIE